MLCAITQVKYNLGIDPADTSADVVLSGIVAGVSSSIARAAGRYVGARDALELTPAGVYQTEFFSPNFRFRQIYTHCFPIVEVSDLREALYEQWDQVTPLVLNQDYQIYLETGELTRIVWFLQGVRTVRLTYRGGYTFATDWNAADTYAPGGAVQYLGVIYRCEAAVTVAGTSPDQDPYVAGLAPTGHWTAAPAEYPLPAFVVEAAVLQSAYWFKRRNQLGVSGGGAAGGNTSWYAKDEFLPQVRDAILMLHPRKYG